MFGNNKRDKRIEEMTLEMQEMNRRLIELKILIVKGNTDTLGNRAAIKKSTGETKIVEVEKEVIVEKIVKVARKKPKPRLRRTASSKRITEDQKMEFIRLYDLGISYTEIASQCHTTSSTVSKYVRPIVEARMEAEADIQLEMAE